MHVRLASITAVALLGLHLLVPPGECAKAPPCPGGRFVIANASLFGGAPTLVIVRDGTAAIGGACAAVAAKRRASRRGTTVKARWASCSGLSRLRLAGTLVESCTRLEGTLKLAGSRPVRFTAATSTCGDGVIDSGGGGEQCDGGAGCDAGSLCDGACHCLPPGVTTTSAPISSTTSTTNSNQPPPFPGLPADVGGYDRWLKLNIQPIPPVPPDDPHDGTKNVFVNQGRETVAPGGQLVYPFPEGTIVVKTASTSGPRSFIQLFAIMRKKAAGTDTAHGDWEFVEYARSGARQSFSEAGRGQVCWDCHDTAIDRDWVYTRLE